MTYSELPRTRPEADALREVFADTSTIVANAIADLLALSSEVTNRPEQPPMAPLAKARAAIKAEEEQNGAIALRDRRRTRFVSAASGIPVDIIRHVLRTRDSERR